MTKCLSFIKIKMYQINNIPIAPVTGSRGNGFGPLFAPVVGAFGAYSLFDVFLVDV